MSPIGIFPGLEVWNGDAATSRCTICYQRVYVGVSRRGSLWVDARLASLKPVVYISVMKSVECARLSMIPRPCFIPLACRSRPQITLAHARGGRYADLDALVDAGQLEVNLSIHVTRNYTCIGTVCRR